MPRDVAPSSDFWVITINHNQTVYVCHVDRTSPWRAEAELAWWTGMFGDQAKLERVNLGEDLVVRHMANAITCLSRDGSGVTRAQIEGLGFAPDIVARRWNDAMTMVLASLPQSEPALPDNVVRLVFKPKGIATCR